MIGRLIEVFCEKKKGTINQLKKNKITVIRNLLTEPGLMRAEKDNDCSLTRYISQERV